MERLWGEHSAMRLNFIKRAGDKLIKSTQSIESNRQVETTVSWLFISYFLKTHTAILFFYWFIGYSTRKSVLFFLPE